MMTRETFLPLLLALAGSLPSSALAGETEVNKSQFHLFRPTPDALMREMATDRPDKTESAYTVDAGHFQVEMDLLAYTYDRSKHEKVKGLAIAASNLKVGVLNNVDLQIIVETYNIQRTKDRDTGAELALVRIRRSHFALEDQPLGQRWRPVGVERDAVRKTPDCRR